MTAYQDIKDKIVYSIIDNNDEDAVERMRTTLNYCVTQLSDVFGVNSEYIFNRLMLDLNSR